MRFTSKVKLPETKVGIILLQKEKKRIYTKQRKKGLNKGKRRSKGEGKFSNVENSTKILIISLKSFLY